MRIAIFDYIVTENNPSGSCHWTIVKNLHREYEFVVFAIEFDNPAPEYVEFVHIPAPKRPLFLCYIIFHIMSLIIFISYSLMRRKKFHVIQFVTSKLIFGNVSYTHFCNKFYLKYHWDEVKSHFTLRRRIARFVDYKLQALLEPFVFKRVRYIVVPSMFLKQALTNTYEFTKDKIRYIPNPIDINKFTRNSNEREYYRKNFGFQDDDIILVFVALGLWENKGLDLIIKSLLNININKFKLIVVGGEPSLIKEWKKRKEVRQLNGRIIFVGFQKDIRPYLWASDLFVFPSSFETFSLVSYQAAAAGLPLLVTKVADLCKFVKESGSGFVVSRDVGEISRALITFAEMNKGERLLMGIKAAEAVKVYNVERFINAWRSFYSEIFKKL